MSDFSPCLVLLASIICTFLFTWVCCKASCNRSFCRCSRATRSYTLLSAFALIPIEHNRIESSGLGNCRPAMSGCILAIGLFPNWPQAGCILASSNVETSVLVLFLSYLNMLSLPRLGYFANWAVLLLDKYLSNAFSWLELTWKKGICYESIN